MNTSILVAALVGTIVSVAGALICLNMAEHRDRRRALWAALGFLFPLPGIIVLALLGRAQPEHQATAA